MICFRPFNDLRMAAYATGTAYLWKVASAGDVKVAIDDEYTPDEQRAKMVSEAKIRGPMEDAMPPYCDGVWHHYESLFLGRWARCCCPCPSRLCSEPKPKKTSKGALDE